MREPKFSEAPCYGKEFDARSKICRVCLANPSCQRKYFTALRAGKPSSIMSGWKKPLTQTRIVLEANVAALPHAKKNATPPGQVSQMETVHKQQAAA